MSYEYDVALSFAGEDRKFVEDCAEILRSLNINVFYDNYEKEVLLGKNLYSYAHFVRYYGGLSCFGCVQLCARRRRTNHHPRCTEISAGAAGCDGRTARCQLLGDDRVYFCVPHAVQQGRAQSAP